MRPLRPNDLHLRNAQSPGGFWDDTEPGCALVLEHQTAAKRNRVTILRIRMTTPVDSLVVARLRTTGRVLGEYSSGSRGEVSDCHYPIGVLVTQEIESDIGD